MMERNNLINSMCWSCWWREGGHCFSENFGNIPKKGITIIGHDINHEHINECIKIDSYVNKRKMLGIIPKDRLIILSEKHKDK